MHVHACCAALVLSHASLCRGREELAKAGAKDPNVLPVAPLLCKGGNYCFWTLEFSDTGTVYLPGSYNSVKNHRVSVFHFKIKEYVLITKIRVILVRAFKKLQLQNVLLAVWTKEMFGVLVFLLLCFFNVQMLQIVG